LRKFVFILLTLIIFACNSIPADPEKSLQIAKTDGLKVGYTPDPPWVIEENSEITGIEGNMVKEFARLNGMKIIWEKGSEQDLMKKLEKKELHIVIAGLLKETPWKTEKIGLTMPYYKNKKEKHVIALMQGENRLLQEIETYFFENKDQIKNIADEALPKF
jgi:polar amino acid transport system substrate-binding protein